MLFVGAFHRIALEYEYCKQQWWEVNTVLLALHNDGWKMSHLPALHWDTLRIHIWENSIGFSWQC